jgi:GcvH upstream region-like protein
MLGFFRKYQKYFFIVITVVIVISFSFFGTYSTLTRNDYVDKPAFTSMDGKEIKRHELEEMVLFLSTDSEDKLLFGGAWGPNFLNDGVLKKDFIETGMAQILVKNYLEDLKSELQARFQKEKRYVPYVHPQAKFLSAVNIWNAIAPQMNIYLNELQSFDDPMQPEAFDIRVKLFQVQRQFPHSALRYVLRTQQKQNTWIASDPNFERTDLSLFGYHTLSDWFGPSFVRLSAEFIINSAQIAQKKGYTVSKGEALADLYRNAESSFEQVGGNPNVGVQTPQEYFDEQLRRMGLDQAKAVNIWRQVMLFRRLFHDLGNSVFVDPFSIEQFQGYAKETIEGDLYKVPESLRLGDFRTLQKFEVYLNAVSDRPQTGVKMLELPQTFKPEEKVAEKYPELVQRRYLLEYAKTDKRLLQAKVSVRKTWDWEVKDKNWEKLKKQFPELGLKPGKTEEERYAALDSLDKKTRARVDTYARSLIVDEHPKWLELALEEAQKEKKVVGIRKKGENEIFAGLQKPEELIELLDKYPESKEKLAKYSPDGNHYYTIVVVEKSPKLELLTYEEANNDGTLDKLLTAYLEKQYEAIREKNTKEYKNSDGTWKPLPQVRNQIAEASFANIIEAIKSYMKSTEGADKDPKDMISDYAASYRLMPYMTDLLAKFKKDPKASESLARVDNSKEEVEVLPPRKPLSEQWKINKNLYKGDRGTKDLPININEVIALKPQDWSDVYVRANGDIAFLQLIEKYAGQDKQSLYESVLQVHRTASIEAQRGLMKNLVSEMEQRHALSLKYLKLQETEEGS